MNAPTHEPLIVFAEGLAALGALAIGVVVSIVYAGVYEYTADTEPDPGTEPEPDEAPDAAEQEADDGDEAEPDEPEPDAPAQLWTHRPSPPRHPLPVA